MGVDELVQEYNDLDWGVSMAEVSGEEQQATGILAVLVANDFSEARLLADREVIIDEIIYVRKEQAEIAKGNKMRF